MFTIAILLMVALLAWLIVKPAFLPAPPENKVTRIITQQADLVKEQSNSWLSKVKPFWKKEGLGAKLKAWASNEDLLAIGGFTTQQKDVLVDFQTWVQQLSDAEADQIAKELADFCDLQQVEIGWILDDHGRGDMQPVLATLVMFYGLAVRERVNSRPAAALRVWEAAPFRKENREMGSQLYVLLVAAGKITIPPELLLAPEKQRLAHIVTSIKALIESDRDALLPYVAQVLNISQVKEAEKPQSAPKKKTKRGSATAEAQTEPAA